MKFMGMMMSEIFKAFVKAQKDFAPALKNSTNPHFKSKYVDLSGCVEAVIDGLNNNGIALVQETSECDNGVIVETVFIHESGESMRCGKLHVPASKSDAQGYGSALTYARRYSLMAACGIAPEDDDGNSASNKKTFDTSPHVKAISSSENMDELRSNFMDATNAANAAKDQNALKMLIKAKDKRKAELAKGDGNGTV